MPSIRDQLEAQLFPHVIKPGRYTGGEPGQIVKNHSGRASLVIIYPDKYEIGQSYVGLQSLYHIVNQDDRFVCERSYAPDLDAEAIMRDKELPLFSMETSRPARDFDAIGFTLVDETVFTNVLACIDLAQVPLRSTNRTDADPLIMAGGPAVYNPEPLAPFVDVFYIGDGEQGLPEMLAVLHELKGAPREAKLQALVKRVKSVYVPKYYDDEARPTVDFAPENIEARLVDELKPDYYPAQPIVPLIETVHDHLSVEIMRGCPQGCRFCFAGPIYRPIRARKPDEIMRQVDTQLKNTGYQEVSLLALSTTDYPELETLVSRLARRIEPLGVSISLPSLRPGSVSPRIFDVLRKVRRFGLTIAPEAGTERLRLFIRKDFPDAAIYDSARIAFSKGWTTLKLYFMVGLPTETEEDLLGIANICRNVYEISREYTKRVTINTTLSPFVPKAHTPFQWDEAVAQNEVFERIKFVKRNLRKAHVNIKHNDTKLAMLVALLGRGGREMAPLLEAAYRAGCRFDAWSEHFKFDTWMQLFADQGIDVHDKLKPIPFTARLPWSHLKKGPSSEHLQKERQRTSRQLKDFAPQYRDEDQQALSKEPEAAFGRGRKRATASNQAVAPTKNRVRVRWAKSDRYRYMSHLDNLHLLERALRRARLPVAYSQGHNPTMKLSLGPPLPLGFTSDAEFIDITLTQNLMGYMIEEFERQLPEGVRVIDARAVLGKRPSLNSQLNRAEYTVPLSMWSDHELLQQAVTQTLDAAALEAERKGKDSSKTVDIRPAVYDIRMHDDRLVMVLGLGDGGYAKPGEVISFLRDGLTRDVVALPMHRQDMYRMSEDGTRINAMDL
ncbi:TIGR03960 family B12-binding radical SAM protein [candidate division GN15 bacterium]|nr:TIGR03960 family B12-binding radical SAM protein [candidate division GN15 bacterium]